MAKDLMVSFRDEVLHNGPGLAPTKPDTKSPLN